MPLPLQHRRRKTAKVELSGLIGQSRVRVTLMVPQGDQLKIQYFANSDGEVPRTKAQDKGFRKKEGCAGWAWATGKTWIVSDVAKFRRESERAIQRGQEFPDYFVNVHEEHIRIMSIVSIPLAFKGYEGGEEVLGVINIDSDVRNFWFSTICGGGDLAHTRCGELSKLQDKVREQTRGDLSNGR